MTSNANLQRVLLDGSKPLDIGRASRLATDAQWRALVARDGGCRFPGCEIPPEWCEVDHIREWAEQHGLTDIDWLVLWCVYHHHFRHRPDVELFGDANNLTMRLPDGRIVPLPPRGPTHTTHTRPAGQAGPARPPGADANPDPGADTPSAAATPGTARDANVDGTHPSTLFDSESDAA